MVVGADAVEGCRHFLRSLGLWSYTESSVQGVSTEPFQDSLTSRNELERRRALEGVEKPSVIPAEVPWKYYYYYYY